jgi:hypothetical protein
MRTTTQRAADVSEDLVFDLRDVALVLGKSAAHTGTCVAAPTESCFNGRDDNCNGLIDCADPACISQGSCVPGLPSSNLGIIVPQAAACPAGYDAADIDLFAGLANTGCGGCTCTPGQTSCTAPVYFYEGWGVQGQTNEECNEDTPPHDGGVYVGDVTFVCPDEPLEESFWGGWRVGEFDVTTDACTPSGTSSPETPTWAQTARFCQTRQVGGGCGAGDVCVPSAPSERVCYTNSTGYPCAPGLVTELWYTGYSDQRVCGACGCQDNGDGNCDNVVVEIGSDWVCGGYGQLSEGEKYCQGTPYSPPAQLIGTPTSSTCSAQGAMSGAVLPTGGRSYCCEP